MDIQKKELWDRLENEPERAYRAFESYLALPSGERTVVEAYRSHVGNPAAIKISDTWAKWSSDFAWRLRASAYDDHLANLRREAYERAIKEEAERQAREVEKIRYRTNELLTVAYCRALECLEDDDWVSSNLRASDVIAITKLHFDTAKALRMDRESKDDGDWNEEDMAEFDDLIKKVDELEDEDDDFNQSWGDEEDSENTDSDPE